MAKTLANPAKPRPKTRWLSTALTAGSCLAASLAAGCGAFNNDWKDHRIAPDSSYDTRLAAGDAARELVSSAHFKSLVVEIGYVSGMAPTQEARNRLQAFLERHLHKPKGVEIILGSEIPASPKGTYSVPELRDIEERYRRHVPQKDQMAIYYLFVDGHSSDDQDGYKLLGQAIHNMSIAIFAETIRKETQSNAGIPRWIAEATVMQHELGHLLGLVGHGLADQTHHEDPRNPGHCSNPACLMYFVAETSAGISALGGQPPELDASCLQDLQALGEN